MSRNPAPAQREAALRRANDVRFAKAAAKQELRSGKLRLLEALRHVPPNVREMRMEELLRAAPGIGPHKVRRILSKANCSPSVRVGRCSLRMREKVLVELASACPGIWSRHGA